MFGSSETGRPADGTFTPLVAHQYSNLSSYIKCISSFKFIHQFASLRKLTKSLNYNVAFILYIVLEDLHRNKHIGGVERQ